MAEINKRENSLEQVLEYFGMTVVQKEKFENKFQDLLEKIESKAQEDDGVDAIEIDKLTQASFNPQEMRMLTNQAIAYASVLRDELAHAQSLLDLIALTKMGGVLGEA